jgi:hypothetical protein
LTKFGVIDKWLDPHWSFGSKVIVVGISVVGVGMAAGERELEIGLFPRIVAGTNRHTGVSSDPGALDHMSQL